MWYRLYIWIYIVCMCARVWIDPVELVWMRVCVCACACKPTFRAPPPDNLSIIVPRPSTKTTQYHHCTTGGAIPLSSDQLQHCRAQSPHSDPQSKRLRPESETAEAVHFTIVPQTCVQSRSSLYAEYACCIGPPKHQGAPLLSKMF